MKLCLEFLGGKQHLFVGVTSGRFHEDYLDVNGNVKSTSIDNATKSLSRAEKFLVDDPEQYHERNLFTKQCNMENWTYCNGHTNLVMI